VYHLHFHIIPRTEGEPLGRHGAGGMADPKVLAQQAAAIAAALA
jgi:histidine triad (HIT) family protein